MERTEQLQNSAAIELSRRDDEVEVKRGFLASAARDRQAIDKLKERQQAEHNAEWARKNQNLLDELAPPSTAEESFPHEHRGGHEPHEPDPVDARDGAAPAPTQPQRSLPARASRPSSRPRRAARSLPRRRGHRRATTPHDRHAATGPSELPKGTPYAAEITAAAKANGLDPALLAGLVKQESGFKADAGSHAGARGLTQLMPATAAGLGVTNVLDPVQNLNGGAKYLKQQLDAFGGDTAKALAAYNAGPGAVKRFGGIPPYAETQNYVRIVQQNAASYRMPSVASVAAPYSSSNAPSEI